MSAASSGAMEKLARAVSVWPEATSSYVKVDALMSDAPMLRRMKLMPMSFGPLP